MIVEEGLAKIEVCEGVFYNPHMKLSRDLSVAVLKAFGKRLSVLDAFTATGVRGIRYALEAGFDPTFLDFNPKAVDCCKKNLRRNGLDAEVVGQDFLEHDGCYGCVELDPFGSPAPFLEKASGMVEEEGILSATATDAMMLCGIQKEPTERFYGSKPLHNEFCHETGLRILMKKVAEELLKRGKGMRPLCSFYYRHQFKTIVQVSEEWQEETRKSIRKGEWRGNEYGPIWVGRLHDKKLLKNAEAGDKRAQKYLQTFLEELDDVPLHYSIPAVCRELKAIPPKIGTIIERLEEEGFRATRTHFSWDAIKTDAPFDVLRRIIERA